SGRSAGVLCVRTASDGRVIDTARRVHSAWPALNQPGGRPTRGAGEGGFGDMSGTPASGMPFIEDGRAHAAKASTPSERHTDNDLSLIVDRVGVGCYLRVSAPSIRRIRSISVVWSAFTSDAKRKT